MLTFADAAKITAKRGVKTIANNTVLHRIDNDTFGVRLHGTNVVLIHRDGTYTLNSGGWRTVTTKDRINKYSPAALYQKDWEWYCGRGESFVFFDEIRVDSAGRVLNADAALAV